MRVWALVCGLLLLLAGCSVVPSTPALDTDTETYEIYFPKAEIAGTDAIGSESHGFAVEGQDGLIEGLLAALLAGPEEAELSTPFPAGVRLRAWLLDDSVLKVDLSEQYGGLSGVNLTVADYCVALTLCQLEGVDAVYITVEGKPISFRTNQRLRATDVLLTGAEGEPIYVMAQLYYLKTGGGLGIEPREILVTEDNTLASAVMTTLLTGPQEAGLHFPLPEGTELISAEGKDGVCYVNFSKEFADNSPTDQHEAALLLYSVVNTLCGLDSAKITSVHLMVEGVSLESYGGIPTATPLEKDDSLVVQD